MRTSVKEMTHCELLLITIFILTNHKDKVSDGKGLQENRVFNAILEMADDTYLRVLKRLLIKRGQLRLVSDLNNLTNVALTERAYQKLHAAEFWDASGIFDNDRQDELILTDFGKRISVFILNAVSFTQEKPSQTDFSCRTLGELCIISENGLVSFFIDFGETCVARFTVPEGLSEQNYFKGGKHGRRRKSGNEGLVQAKYHFSPSLKTALKKAAAAQGLSTSDFLETKLSKDSEISPFIE